MDHSLTLGNQTNSDKELVNIKNMLGLNTISPSERVTTSAIRQVDRSIKSENTEERDANGQQAYSGSGKKKQKMTEEQVKRAIEILNQKPWMQEMQWQAVVVVESELSYAEVRDSAGAVIRRIVEYDLWELFEEVRPGEEKKGQLLKKTA